MSKRKRETVEILTGAAALLVIAGGVAWTYGGSRGATDGYQVTALYRNVDGVSLGSEVRMSGIIIGKVSSLRYDGARNRAVLEMTIRDGIRIPTDSAAKVVSESMLGEKYIKIEPGGNEETLKPGKRFRFVQNSVVVEEVLQRVIIEVEQSRALKKKASE